jgi:uncharacterized damage-inducible protein DinB
VFVLSLFSKLSQGAKYMSETSKTLAFFTEGWQYYQDQVSRALAPLSAEQLALRAAPNLRSVGELACHIIAARAGWLHYNLEEGESDLAAFTTWGEPGSPPRSASELVRGLEKTWQVMQEVLGRYTLSDLHSTIQDEWKGQIYTLTRGWVIWHLIELDLHHGGEIAYALRIYGLPAWEEGGKRDLVTPSSIVHPLIREREEETEHVFRDHPGHHPPEHEKKS